MAGLKDIPSLDVKIMDKNTYDIYRNCLVKQEDNYHFLFKITWVLSIFQTSGVLTVIIATPMYLFNRWRIQKL